MLSETPAQNGITFSMGLGHHFMNKDILEGKLNQMRGNAKTWWGKFTDDDLDIVAGIYDALAGLLHEKYFYTRQRGIR